MTSLMRRNSLFPVMDNFFDDFFTKDLFDWNDKNFTAMGGTLPSVNVRQNDKEIAIDLAAPGMKKEDFKIELDKNVLTISSEKKNETEEKDEKGKYTRKEFNYCSFSRSFTLPGDVVESDRIEASYNDGILHLVVPKKEQAKTRQVKSITVK